MWPPVFQVAEMGSELALKSPAMLGRSPKVLEKWSEKCTFAWCLRWSGQNRTVPFWGELIKVQLWGDVCRHTDVCWHCSDPQEPSKLDREGTDTSHQNHRLTHLKWNGRGLLFRRPEKWSTERQSDWARVTLLIGSRKTTQTLVCGISGLCLSYHRVHRAGEERALAKWLEFSTKF